MAFTLPTDLSTSWVDNSSTIAAADFNNISAMGNALKAAVATMGYGSKRISVETSETTTTTASYTDLATTTDQVTVAIGSSGKALVFFGSQIANSATGGYGYVAVDVSGANTIAASDDNAIKLCSNANNSAKQHSNAILFTGLTAGVTTFKLKYKVSANTGTFANRRIAVIPLSANDGTHESASFDLNLSSSLSFGMGGAGVNRPDFDSVGAGYKAGGSSGSWSHTIGANAKALFVAVVCTDSVSAAVTVGGTSMTKLVSQPTFSGAATLYLYVFGMLNPPTGAQTIAVTGAAASLCGNSIAYNNVAGLGCPQVVTGTGASSSQTATTSNPGRTWFQVFGSAGNAEPASYNQNERWKGYQAGAGYPVVMGDAGASTGSTSFTTTQGNTNGWAGIAVELMPSVPTYSKPQWVGTGLGADRKTNPGYSWVESVPADANLALLWLSEMPSDQANTCSVTLGGTSMVEVTGSPWTYDYTSGYNRLRCFMLQNPPTGIGKTVAITANVSNNFHAHTVYYGGVTTVGAAAYTRGLASTSPSLTVANSSSTHLYAYGAACRPDDGNSTFTAASGNLRAVHNNGNGGYTQPLVVCDAYGNDSTLTLTATRNGTMTYGWGGVFLDLSPSASSAPYSVPTWVGTGAGRPHFSGNYSWTETVPADATCAVVVLSVMGSTACSVTLGGTSMTALYGSPFTYYSGNYSTQTFYLLNPATGAGKTLAVTNSNGNNVHATAVFYGGVAGVFNQAANTAGAIGEQPSMTVANTVATHRYLNVMSYRPTATGDTITAYNQTQRAEYPTFSYDVPMIVGDALGNGGTLTFSGTRNTTYQWGGMTVDLSPDTRPAAAFNLSLTPSISMAARPVVQGINTSATTSVTIPTHATGDIIVIWAMANSSNTIPTKPSASGTVPSWSDIDASNGSNTASSRTAYFVATANNHTSGTWTGATQMAAVVLRGQGATPIGGHAETGDTNATDNTAPSVTLAKDWNSSTLLHFIGTAASPTWNAAPTGYTQLVASGTVCVLSKDSTATDGSVTQTHSSLGSARYRAATVEVRSS